MCVCIGINEYLKYVTSQINIITYRNGFETVILSCFARYFAGKIKIYSLDDKLSLVLGCRLFSYLFLYFCS